MAAVTQICAKVRTFRHSQLLLYHARSSSLLAQLCFPQNFPLAPHPPCWTLRCLKAILWWCFCMLQLRSKILGKKASKGKARRGSKDSPPQKVTPMLLLILEGKSMTPVSSPSQPGALSWRESLLACSSVSADLQNMSLKKKKLKPIYLRAFFLLLIIWFTIYYHSHQPAWS